MINRLIILVSLLLNAFYLVAQVSESDSLEKQLNQYRSSDTFKVELLNTLALSLYNSDSNRAFFYSKESGKLADSLNYEKGKVENLLFYGRYYYDNTNYYEALNYFNQALELSESLKYKRGTMKSLHSLGNIYYTQTNYHQALECYQKSMDLAVEIKDNETYLRLLNNIGSVYMIQKNYEKALEWQFKALKIAEQLKDSGGVSLCLTNIGIDYDELKEFDKALEYYYRSLEIDEKSNNKPGILYNLNSIGYTYYEQNKFSLAIEYFNKAMEKAEELGDEYMKSNIFMNFGSINFKQGNFSNAIKDLNKSLKIAQKLGVLDSQSEVYKILSEIYVATHNYSKAYVNYKLYTIFHDSIFNGANIKKITELEYTYKYEKEKQAAELEQSKKDAVNAEKMKRQKVILFSFITGFIIMILFLIIVIRFNGLIRRSNAILKIQKDEIEIKNKELFEANENITSSINYASRIQQAILPSNEILKKYLPDYFLLHKPRDIVSGDFFWISNIENKTIIAAVDCTGHGVPGAFMSMLGSTLLNEIVNKEYITHPGVILQHLRKEIIRSLHQRGEFGEQKDGMDLVLSVIDFDSLILEFSGANNPLYIIRDSENKKLNNANQYVYNGKILYEIKGDKMPISYSDVMEKFTVHEIELTKGDQIYLFSDGFADQFGGQADKKLNYKNFRRLLLESCTKTMIEQRIWIEKEFEQWRGDISQTDDILVVGIRIT
jgi:tetratricopeptide (TPR) repeat protein